MVIGESVYLRPTHLSAKPAATLGCKTSRHGLHTAEHAILVKSNTDRRDYHSSREISRHHNARRLSFQTAINPSLPIKHGLKL